MKTIIFFFMTLILLTCIAKDSCSKEAVITPYNIRKQPCPTLHCYPKEECCPNECGLVGKWKNELGSTVIFTSCKDGQLEGKYNTAVDEASDYYVLTGRYTVSDGKVVELGWVVSWNNEKYGNSNSATSWNGIYYPPENPEDEGIIHTQWILTRYAAKKDLWSSSMINHDEFERA